MGTGNAAVKIFEKFRTHPAIQQIEAEAAAEILKGRKEAATRIAQAQKRAEKVVSDLRAKVDAVKDEIKALGAARKVLLRKLHDAEAAVWDENAKIEREISAAKRELLNCYDPAIDEAISYIRERRAIIERSGFSSDTEMPDPRTGGTKKVTRSNYAELIKALEHCRNAVVELEEMKLQPAVDLDRIGALKAIPGYKNDGR
ncbi:MAG: hypothetical protein C4576_19725 [Desulfobacteraceae bacterium]|nr:MAG: hypothetical protein C4576_19725 [Desulfobacteraceae bacterium]